MSDTRTRELVRELIRAGTVVDLDRAVNLLVRDGLTQAEAERKAFGIGHRDVATVRIARRKTHLVSARVPYDYGSVDTWCGRRFYNLAVSWNTFEEFKATWNACKSCLNGTRNLMGKTVHERSCYALRLRPLRCRRGHHKGIPCVLCATTAALLFNAIPTA